MEDWPKLSATSIPETTCPEVWSSVSNVIKTKQSSSGAMNEPKIQAARQMKKNHDIFADEAEEFDAVCSERQKED